MKGLKKLSFLITILALTFSVAIAADGPKKEGKKEVRGGRQQDREKGDARKEARGTQVRSVEEESEEPKASDCHCAVRSSSSRRQSPPEEEEGFAQESGHP